MINKKYQDKVKAQKTLKDNLDSDISVQEISVN